MKIKNILSISDTRQVAEVDGRMKALSGTGERNACALCGALHEIHALVEFDTGSVAIVGVACAKKNSPVSLKRHAIWEKMRPLMDRRAELLNLRHSECVEGEYIVGREFETRKHGWGWEKDTDFYQRRIRFEDHCCGYGWEGQEIYKIKQKLKKLQDKMNELN